MVQFMDLKTENAFRRFVNTELAHKLEQPIEVRDAVIVKDGLNGDEIVEALKVSFFPAYSKTEWIEDKIATDLHKYVFENDLGLLKSPVIEKDVWNGEIRYSLVYTYAGDYHNCEECARKCKQGVKRCVYFEKL